MAKKDTLTRKQAYNKEEYNFTLLGINTPMRDYRLCHEINRVLDISLEKVDDHCISFGLKMAPVGFSKYVFTDTSNFQTILIQNKSNEHRLIPEMQLADYFMIFLPYYPGNIEPLHKSLFSIKNVQMVFDIVALKLQHRDNLLF
ncbi:MAG: IPExxxVDY family protein [Bacteroidetes bacterium]|nr:IPExxxVDY family protein [Bacteroidota bacterium]